MMDSMSFARRAGGLFAAGRRFALGALAAVAAALAAPAALAEPYYLIVAGLGGQPDYEKQFVADAKSLAAAARRTVGDPSRVALMTGSAVSRAALETAFREMAGKLKASDTAVVILIGHGSYDGEHYKFNIPGPDVDGDELSRWLAALPARSQLVVDTTSASGAVLKKWSADGRTVITATRSGAERNATRFGTEWAEALSSKEADTNKDGVVTAKEAFDYASRKVADSYKSEGTLATEHPQLEGEGAPHLMAARLTERGTRTPEVAALYSQLGDLEGRIEALRQRKDTLQQTDYLDQLQALLVQLAKVQQKIDAAEGKGGKGSADAAAAEPPADDAPASTATKPPQAGAADGSGPRGIEKLIQQKAIAPDETPPVETPPPAAEGQGP